MKSDKREVNKLLKKDKLTEKEEEKLKLYTKRIETNEKRLQRKKEIREAKKGNEYKIIINKQENVKWLILVMIICAFTGIITPIGDTPYTYLLHTMQGNTTGSIAEHLPIVLFNNKETMIAFSVILALIIFTDTKMKLSDMFLVAGLMFLTFMSRRQYSMFLFVGGIALIRMICGFIQLHSSNDDVENAKGYIVTFIGQLITYTLVILATVCLFMKIKDNQIVNSNSYPVEACDYILDNLDVENIKLFNDYNYGSYLMFRGIPVFIDSRADVYDPKFNGLEDDIFQDYINIYGLNCYYEDQFEYYGITHVMSYANSKLALYVSKDTNYNEIYKDDNFVIYERLKK